MKPMRFEDMIVYQLVQRFVVIGTDQDNALRTSAIAKFNRLFGEKKAIERELKSRDGDQRRALLDLYDHPNAQVRLNAVKATLALAPEAGRRMLEAIADSREYPQAGDASMTISALDQGIFKLT